MKLSQKGFAALEGLLILVIIVIIAGTGWYVWHSKSQADKNLNAAVNSSQSSPNRSKKTASSLPKKINAPATVDYDTVDAPSGVGITSASDVDKLDGASNSFKDFVKDKVAKHSPSPCGNAYGLFVKKIYKDQFALGGENDCKHTDKLWAKVSDAWKEIGSTDQNFDCSLLDQYKVPAAIVEHCIKNGQVVNNNQ
jgi:hypothetical protein